MLTSYFSTKVTVHVTSYKKFVTSNALPRAKMEIPFNDPEKILPGPQPVMVSGFGTSPGRQLQTGFPSRLSTQVVPGPQGEGLHGSGRGTQAFWMQTWP